MLYAFNQRCGLSGVAVVLVFVMLLPVFILNVAVA